IGMINSTWVGDNPRCVASATTPPSRNIPVNERSARTNTRTSWPKIIRWRIVPNMATPQSFCARTPFCGFFAPGTRPRARSTSCRTGSTSDGTGAVRGVQGDHLEQVQDQRQVVHLALRDVDVAAAGEFVRPVAGAGQVQLGLGLAAHPSVSADVVVPGHFFKANADGLQVHLVLQA